LGFGAGITTDAISLVNFPDLMASINLSYELIVKSSFLN